MGLVVVGGSTLVRIGWHIVGMEVSVCRMTAAYLWGEHFACTTGGAAKISDIIYAKRCDALARAVEELIDHNLYFFMLSKHSHREVNGQNNSDKKMRSPRPQRLYHHHNIHQGETGNLPQ